MFVLTVDLVTMCHVKVNTHSDKSTKSYYLTLQSTSALLSDLASVSSFYSLRLYCFDSVSQLSLGLFTDVAYSHF